MELSVEQRVLNVIAKIKNCDPLDISLMQPIKEVCDTSLDLVTLLFDLEDEFAISIPDEAKDQETILDMVRGVEMLVHAKQKAEIA